jgi:hypothetical protein
LIGRSLIELGSDIENKLCCKGCFNIGLQKGWFQETFEMILKQIPTMCWGC